MDSFYKSNLGLSVSLKGTADLSQEMQLLLWSECQKWTMDQGKSHWK